MLYDYVWDNSNTQSRHEAKRVESLFIGIGTLCNAHSYFHNLDMTGLSIDSAGLHRSKDPGVGAFSDRFDNTWLATKDISPGSDCFVHYGDPWFIDREKETGPIPIKFHYDEVDEILQELFTGGDDGEGLEEKYDSLMEDVTETRVRILLPETIDEAKKALEVGTARFNLPESIRTREWSDENGLYLDNIMNKNSTLFQAGRGAFATRNL